MKSKEIGLTPEEIKMFDRFYQSRLEEAGGAWNDAQELEISRDILAAVVDDGLTPTIDGGASYVRRGAVDWANRATFTAAQEAIGEEGALSPSPAGRGRKKSKSELWQGVGVLAVAIIAVIWFFWPSGDENAVAEGEVESAEIVEATAEIEGRVTRTPAPTLEAELLADVIGAGVKAKELVVPRTLEIKGVSFVVQPVNTKQGDWQPPGDERAVSWIYGTVINYVLGLEATPANKELLASLKSGDELLLRASTGRPVFRFAYADTVRVAPQASEIFRQKRPGLTLVLLNDGVEDSRVVIRGIYLPESELDSVGLEPEESAEVGQRMVLGGGVGITCLGREIVTTNDAPSGYTYIGVNYIVEQLRGDLPLVTAAFSHRLEAGGLAYPMVSVSEEVMSYPALPETLVLGEAFTATLVYAVPEPALREEMVWKFASDPSEPKVSVKLPRYEGLLEPEVAISRSEFTDDNLLNLTFEIKAGLHRVEVGREDVDIQVGGTLHPVVNTFPWQVVVGETGEFSLVISPDGSGEVRVVVLKQGFEITY